VSCILTHTPRRTQTCALVYSGHTRVHAQPPISPVHAAHVRFHMHTHARARTHAHAKASSHEQTLAQDTCAHVHAGTRAHTCTHTHTRTHTHVPVCKLKNTCPNLPAYTQGADTHLQTLSSAASNVHARMHAPIHACVSGCVLAFFDVQYAYIFSPSHKNSEHTAS
jgi:hypothetical protein